MGILIVLLVLSIFAVYRLATDFAEEEGPFSLYMRARAFVSYNPESWLYNGVRCPVCLSFWISIPFAVALVPLTMFDWVHLPIVWLGIAGTVVYMLGMRR